MASVREIEVGACSCRVVSMSPWKSWSAVGDCGGRKIEVHGYRSEAEAFAAWRREAEALLKTRAAWALAPSGQPAR